MMRARFQTRLRHLIAIMDGPFTLRALMTKWSECFGFASAPTRAQLAYGLRELRASGLIERVGFDDQQHQLWEPVRD